MQFTVYKLLVTIAPSGINVDFYSYLNQMSTKVMVLLKVMTRNIFDSPTPNPMLMLPFNAYTALTDVN